MKHVHTGPTNVPQLHTVPSENAQALGPDAQLDPSAGGEAGQPVCDVHGPNAPSACPHSPSAQANICRHSGSCSSPYVHGGDPTDPGTPHAVPALGGVAGQLVAVPPVPLLDELDEEVAAPPWLDDVLVPPPAPVVVPEPWTTTPEPQ